MPKTKMKIFFNSEIEDQPFPEPLSYEHLVVKPTKLEDINAGEGGKLGGIEEGATVGADESNLSVGALARLFSDETARANVEAWRKSGALTKIDGQKIYTKSIYAEDIKAGTMTGFTIQTAVSGQRIVLTGNTFSGYDASALRIRIESDLIKCYDDNGNLRCQLEGVDTGQEGVNGIKIDANPGGGGFKYFLSSAGFVFVGGQFSGDIILTGSGNHVFVGGSFGSPQTVICGADADSVIGKGLKITGNLLPQSNDAYNIGSSSKNFRNIYISDNSSYGIYFGGTKRIYMSAAGVVGISGALDVSGDIECDDLLLKNGSTTIKGDGTHVEFNGLSNAHLVPASGLINSAQLGTASNYWHALHYGSGGLNAHSTPLSEKDEIAQLRTFKNKIIIDRKTKKSKLVIDKKAVDKDLMSDGGEAIRLDKVVMALVGAVQKIDDHLNNKK